MRVHEIVLTPNGVATVWHNALVPLKDEHLYRVYHEEIGEYEYFYLKNGKKVTLTTSKDRKKNAKIHKYLRMLNKALQRKSEREEKAILTEDYDLVAVD